MARRLTPLSTFQVCTLSFIIRITLGGGHDYPQLTDEKTESWITPLLTWSNMKCLNPQTLARARNHFALPAPPAIRGRTDLGRQGL